MLLLKLRWIYMIMPMPMELDPAPQAALLCAIAYNSKPNEERAYKYLESLWGKIRYFSAPYRFIGEEYYAKEMGKNLKKKMIVFEERISPHFLSDCKIRTIEIERKMATYSNHSTLHRSVNIDPGIITPESIVLSTTKNSGHRICISAGIFAETTLLYQKGKYNPLPWTYLDYQSEESQQLFLKTRRWLRTINQIHS